MRTIKYTHRFKRDYRREQSGRHSKTLDVALLSVVNLLATDVPLPRQNFDHPLSGEWADHRDCHIKPDLVLISYWVLPQFPLREPPSCFWWASLRV